MMMHMLSKSLGIIINFHIETIQIIVKTTLHKIYILNQSFRLNKATLHKFWKVKQLQLSATHSHIISAYILQYFFLIPYIQILIYPNIPSFYNILLPHVKPLPVYENVLCEHSFVHLSVMPFYPNTPFLIYVYIVVHAYKYTQCTYTACTYP